MNIQLHENARTMPAIRLEIQAQPESVSNRELTEAYHLNRHTVAKWRRREGMEDASHPPPVASHHPHPGPGGGGGRAAQDVVAAAR